MSQLSETTEQVVATTDDDNPSQMLHLICPWCYPEDPPLGTPVVRWCGQVVTLKVSPLVLSTGEIPADACVICATLPNCSTCGARNTQSGIAAPGTAS